MKKLLSIILALCMVVSTTAVLGAETVNPFSDVSENAWYHDEIVKAVKTGIINGKSETIFAPDDLLTYAEAIKLAACMNQVYSDGEVTLKPGKVWYEPFVEYCEENEIVTKKYSYNESVTRAGYMEIFANALPDEAYEEINNIPDGSILDVEDNAPYAIYVYKLYRAGIVTGVDEAHNCNPEANIKRSEVAAIISRMMNGEERQKFNMTLSQDEITNEGTIEDDGEKNKAEPITNTDVAKKPEDEPIISDVTVDTEIESIVVEIPTTPVNPEIEVVESPTLSILTIHKQPEGIEAKEYGTEHKLEVQVFGGRAPYTYEWFYYTGNRNDKSKIENGSYVKAAETGTLVLSIEKDNALLGKQIYCQVTDSEGTNVSTDKVKVYGPFSMPVESDTIITSNKEYELAGRIADGVIRKGDKVSVERNGKIIATGTVSDIKMFNKSLDKGVKNDYAGLVFVLEEGVKPTSGDIVIKYKEGHVIDTSDIVN